MTKAKLNATTAQAKPTNGVKGDPTWHDAYDARIMKNPDLGTVPTADMYRAALTLGPVGKGKRAGVEALWVAMTLRAEGATIAQYTAAGECRTANNWLQYLNDEGTRHVYSQVHVNRVEGKRYTRLTPKGVAVLKAAGMNAQAVDRLAKPFQAPKAPVSPKVTAKASGKAKGERKPAGQPIQAPKPAAAPAAPAKAPDQPRQVLTESGPKPLTPPAQQPGDSK